MTIIWVPSRGFVDILNVPLEVLVDELPATALLADNTANPTLSAIQVFPMFWDTLNTVWQRLRGRVPGDGIAQHQGVATLSQLMGWNGSALDRIRALGDNATNPTVGKIPTLPARANASNPAWTEGNLVPLSTDLAGNLRQLMNSWFGSTAPTVGQKTMANSIPVVIASDQSTIPTSGGGGGATDSAGFTAHFDSIAPATNKYMATIFNTSATRKVVIQKITVIIEVFTAVTGVFLNQSLMFITARTAGTSVTPRANDSNDSLSAGITADHNSSAVTDGHEKFGFLVSSEEVLTAFTNLQLGGNFIGRVIYEKKDGVKGITLRQNQGISIKNITASTVASFSYLIEFTDETA